MKPTLTFDDVLILPQFSSIESREKVDTTSSFMGLDLKLPIISSNMDTVTETAMCVAMSNSGGIGCLHRFMSVEKNAYMFEQVKKLGHNAMVSVGVGDKELERFEALLAVKAEHFILDVANGANMNVVKQVEKMNKLAKGRFQLMVGNFATGRSIDDFLYHLGSRVDALKVGIGPGSACTTREVSGCGMPLLSSIIDCVRHTHVPIIADGGIRKGGDFAKALGAGARAVMVGGLLAGTEESPSEIGSIFIGEEEVLTSKLQEPIESYLKLNNCRIASKKYRGSASAESYEAQGKVASHRAPEGESFLVPYVGTVSSVLQPLEGGLRGAMTTVGAENFYDFKERVEFIQITSNGVKENSAHGKTKS